MFLAPLKAGLSERQKRPYLWNTRKPELVGGFPLIIFIFQRLMFSRRTQVTTIEKVGCFVFLNLVCKRADLYSVCSSRDRENSTVFVADLPTQVTEDELKELFKDVSQPRFFFSTCTRN